MEKNEQPDRMVVFLTGKGGAILCYMSIREALLTKQNKSREKILKELHQYAKELHSELKEGVYKISTNPEDNFIVYLGETGEL